MSETNRTTLESYDAHIQEYVEGTPQEVTGGVKEWIDASLEGLPQDARILEFGTAFVVMLLILRGWAIKSKELTLLLDL